MHEQQTKSHLKQILQNNKHPKNLICEKIEIFLTNTVELITSCGMLSARFEETP